MDYHDGYLDGRVSFQSTEEYIALKKCFVPLAAFLKEGGQVDYTNDHHRRLIINMAAKAMSFVQRIEQENSEQ